MDDLTLIVTLSRSDEMIREWVNALAADPDLRNHPIIVTHDEGKQHLLDEIKERLQPVRTVQLATPVSGVPDPGRTEVLRGVTTRYVAVLPVPRRVQAALESLKNHLSRRREDLAEATPPPGLTPVFLPTPQRQRMWIRSYLHDHEDMFAEAPEYFALLAAHAGSFSLEAVDIGSGGEITLHARVGLGRFNLSQPLPWDMRLAIVDHQGEVLASTLAEKSQRVDSHGNRRWENLTARIKVTDLPEGNHQIRVQLASAGRLTRQLVPTPGLLAGARTRVARTESHATILLIHTTGKATRTWITIRHGGPTELAGSWKRELVRKDLRSTIRDRAAGRVRLGRLIRTLTAPFYRNRNIWLIGERVDTAQDNGMHFFHHLRSAHPDRDVYYILDRASPHWDRVAGLGNVVAHSSMKHRLLMLHAEVVANSYSIKHMTPRQWNPVAYTQYLAWRVGALRVYLKHGVHMATNSVKRGAGGYDLYLTVNPQETAAFRADSGYDSELRETGLPRYDALYPSPHSRTVLFMPTWRRYLVPKLFADDTHAQIPFAGSTYEQFLTSLLTSPRLQEILERYDYRFLFLPHYNVAEFFDDLPVRDARIALADTANQTFTELLTSCDLFVTDYSSVHFDVAYVGTPIIYAQFDREEYLSGHASISWFDFGRDGFGPVATTVEATLDAIEAALDRGCSPDPQYLDRVERAFTYRDHNNCARVVSAVDELVASYREETDGRLP